MAEYKYPHEEKYPKYEHVPAYEPEESPPEPKYGYIEPKYGYIGKTTVKVKKVKGYAPVSHCPPHHCPPIVCDPQYVVRDRYIPREVPVVHPVVNVNRHVIVNVPKHYCKPITKNVVVDPGCPCPPHPGYY